MFHGPVILHLYLEDYLMEKTSDFGMLIQCDLKIPVGHSDLYFMVQWVAFILKPDWCFGILSQCDTTFDL